MKNKLYFHEKDAVTSHLKNNNKKISKKGKNVFIQFMKIY